MKKSFEEQFPNLKGIKCCCYECNEYPMTTSCKKRGHAKTFNFKDIQKHCIDKQRIQKLFKEFIKLMKQTEPPLFKNKKLLKEFDRFIGKFEKMGLEE